MNNVRPEWRQLRDLLECGDFSAAAALLGKDPSLISERNGLGETVLHFLAIENNQPAVEWLHTHGGDLNSVNEFGTPLLFEVAQLGYRDLFLWLIKHGADPDKKNANGEGIEDYLNEYGLNMELAFIKQHI